MESGAGRPELLPHLQLGELLTKLQVRLQAALGTRRLGPERVVPNVLDAVSEAHQEDLDQALAEHV